MAACDWSSLPEGVWQLVLHRVPLSKRLGSCSRVCVTLYRASAAATQHLELDLSRQYEMRAQRFEGFRNWLQQHGQHVPSLQLFSLDSVAQVAELPCWHLRQLGLKKCHVQLGDSSSQPGILSALPELQQLHLERCWPRDGAEGLASLTAITGLQHLEVDDLRAAHQEKIKLPMNVLHQLTQLTSLLLDGSVCPTAASVAPFSSLQHLQQLQLGATDMVLSPSSTPGLTQLTALTKLSLREVDLAVLYGITQLQHLQLRFVTILGALLPTNVLQQLTQLTSLHLDYSVRATAASLEHISSLQQLQELLLSGKAFVLSPSSTPGLMQLTALTKLGLIGTHLDPAVLCGVMQLQHLELHFITILGASDAAPLLSLIGQQQQLQLLTLEGPLPSPAAPAAYTALTASSKLQQLYLYMYMHNVSVGFWQAVFRPSQQLPDLQSFSTSASCCEGTRSPRATPFSTPDIGALASCCPRLQMPTIAVDSDAQLSALSKLTAAVRAALTYLSVSLRTAAAVQSMAAITQLRHLYVWASPLIGKTALLPLTSLQRLKVLCAEEAVDDDHYGDVMLRFIKRPAADAPDVWQQLLENCQ